jgi:hypothetical protein
MIRYHFMSLMIFPFLTLEALYSIYGIEPNDTFLKQLLEHNMKVLSYVFLTTESETSSGDNNEN